MYVCVCVCNLSVHAQVTHREFMGSIHDMFGCTMSVRGVHVEKGRQPNPGEQPFSYSFVEGPTQISVDKAAREVVRYLEEVALQVGFSEKERAGKYSVL